MFLNDSVVCFAGARTASYSYKCTNAMTGDFTLIIDLIYKKKKKKENIFFKCILKKTLPYAFKACGIWHELPGIIL